MRIGAIKGDHDDDDDDADRLDVMTIFPCLSQNHEEEKEVRVGAMKDELRRKLKEARDETEKERLLEEFVVQVSTWRWENINTVY